MCTCVHCLPESCCSQQRQDRDGAHLDFPFLGSQLQGCEALMVADLLQLHSGAEAGPHLEKPVIHVDHQCTVLGRVVCNHYQSVQDCVPQGVSGLQAGRLVRVLQEVGHHIPLLGACSQRKRQLSCGPRGELEPLLPPGYTSCSSGRRPGLPEADQEE